jgi:hypothetical protein
MTKADCVYSTPPTNTPVDPTRRRFLTGAAGAAVVGIPTSNAGASEPDPIYAAIEAHRNAHAAHMAALELQARLEKTHRASEVSWVSTKPCHDANDAFDVFIAAPATTLPGLLAKLAYLQDLASDFETEWMIEECVGTLSLINSFAASIDNIMVQSA